MLQLALPMHAQMYPGHGDHSDLTGRDRENKIIGEVLDKISKIIRAATSCNRRSSRHRQHQAIHSRKENRFAWRRATT